MRHGSLSLLGLLLLLVGCQQSSNQPPSPEVKQQAAKRLNRELHSASPQQRQEAEQEYQEIVAAYANLTSRQSPNDPQILLKMHKKVEPIVARIRDPIVLRELVIVIFTQERKEDDQGVACEAIFWSFSCCLQRLVKIGSDDAARELVNLFEVDECHWDGGTALALEEYITRMGKKALPYLNEMPNRLNEATRLRLIDYIRRGEIQLP